MSNRFAKEIEKDLLKSGLSIEDAVNAGIYELSRAGNSNERLKKLIGFGSYDGHNLLKSTSAILVIPYSDTDFVRVKLYPSINGARYLQPQNSGSRLYIPSTVQGILKNPVIDLTITEGEKKALKACKEGLACLGIGGLWNWLQNGKPIPELDGIAWVERSITLVPDGDVWTRKDLIRAVYAFGKELEGRGAKVRVKILPMPDGEKIGLDDFLVAHKRDGYDRLKVVSLKHATFNEARAWHKEWFKKRQEVEKKVPALELLEQIAQIRRLHPAQDFIDGVLWYGVPVHDDLVVFVNSNREIFRDDELPENIIIHNEGFDLCRLSPEGISRFLKGEVVGTVEVIKELREYFGGFVIFRDRRIPLLLSLWTMATYIYRSFNLFPYLSFRSPVKECGKSRTEDLLSYVAFNAESRESSPTEATLFRAPSRNGGTILLDEIESLTDKERFGHLVAVLNSGFEKGGVVKRLERQGDKFVERKYSTYCPRALAGISKLANPLEGRAITIFMQRKLTDEKLPRVNRAKMMGKMQSTRDRLYIWALCHINEVQAVYEGIESFSGLASLGDRDRDLWEPLVTIPLSCEDKALVDETCSLAEELSKVRIEIDSSDLAMVINRLDEILGYRGQLKHHAHSAQGSI